MSKMIFLPVSVGGGLLAGLIGKPLVRCGLGSHRRSRST